MTKESDDEFVDSSVVLRAFSFLFLYVCLSASAEGDPVFAWFNLVFIPYVFIYPYVIPPNEDIHIHT